MRTPFLISVIALAAASPLLAQSRNIDFGDASGVPSDSFAGAGAAGPWEVWPGTGATNHSETTGDLERLLDDFESWSEAMGWITFKGLENGVYRVITYVWNPDDDSIGVVWIDASEIIEETSVQYVRGAWPGGLELGITHARHRATILDGYLSIWYPLGRLQGIQLLLLDCNDVAFGFDCNENGILDECEDDCNYNAIADECEIADGTAFDCNENGILDECEECLGLGAIATSCAPWPLFPDPNGYTMNRYVSFATRYDVGCPGPPPPVAGAWLELVRVTLVDVPGFPEFNGEKRWVGAPGEFNDEGLGTFIAAELQCDMPVAVEWTSFDVVNVFGAEIVPGSTYHVQRTAAGCPISLDDDGCFSDPLVVTTGKWGDVVEPFGGKGQPDFTDIASLVDKFQSLASGPPKARAQLQPNVPDPSKAVDFSDIAAAIDAFTGSHYPFDGPVACP